MNVLLISKQPLLLGAFLAYAEYSVPNINFAVVEGDVVPDAVLIDAKWYHEKTLRALAGRYKKCPVFILSDRKKRASLFAVEGLSGVFTYDVSKGDILKTISLFLKPESKLKAPKAITVKEEIILDYLKQGQSNKEIARVLDVQPSVVKYHVRQICKKMGVENRTQVALRASEISV